MTVLLEVRDLHCGYQDNEVIHGVSFHVNRGALVCLLGPSGCGKTTLLRCIAGFEDISAGEIVLDTRVLSSPGHVVAPEQRGIGMVFQEATLFPHLSVRDNVAFGLKNRSSAQILATVGEMLELVGLDDLGNRFPHELSGGQQQRVALARAMAPRPPVILLDEPFSSLDVELRERLGADIRAVLKSLDITALLVTHDQSEAFALAEQIGVVDDGHVPQWDTPYNLYHEPANRFVADFIGLGVFVPGTMVAPDTVDTELGRIMGNRAYPWKPGSKVDVLLRPDDIQPVNDAPMRARIVAKAFKGAQILYSLQLATGSTVLSLFPSHDNHELGDQVGVSVRADHLVAFLAGAE